MKLNAYCIFDSAASVYQRPFFVGADGEAVRLFIDLVEEKDHPVGKHPECYSLFRVGSFNDQNGSIVDDKEVECLCTGLDVGNLDLNNLENKYGS